MRFGHLDRHTGASTEPTKIQFSADSSAESTATLVCLVSFYWTILLSCVLCKSHSFNTSRADALQKDNITGIHYIGFRTDGFNIAVNDTKFNNHFLGAFAKLRKVNIRLYMCIYIYIYMCVCVCVSNLMPLLIILFNKSLRVSGVPCPSSGDTILPGQPLW
jgi:hypothetical protein